MKTNNAFIRIILNILEFSFFALLLITFSSCSINEGEAQLTIINNSSVTLEKVYWRNTSFGNISPGNEVTNKVSGIDDPVFIRFHKGGTDTEYYTDDIKVASGTHATFVFTDDTKVHYFK